VKAIASPALPGARIPTPGSLVIVNATLSSVVAPPLPVPVEDQNATAALLPVKVKAIARANAILFLPRDFDVDTIVPSVRRALGLHPLAPPMDRSEKRTMFIYYHTAPQYGRE
jgi:hypothetical protein